MTQRGLWVALVLIAVVLFAALVNGQQVSQSPTAPSAGCGRYQFVDSVVTKVFDTQTGKIYLWFPRDEKAGTDPYVVVIDPVTGTGTRVEIKWTKKTTE